MSTPLSRPPFLLATAALPEEPGKYPQSDEVLSYGRPIGKLAGLERIGLHLERVEPGHRTSYPHAEQDEEEFVYVLEGTIDAWIDGVLYPMTAGELAAFPAGTGVCHCFVNNGERDVLLLVGGEASKRESKIFYPRNPERRGQQRPEQYWADVPMRPQGPHDGKPDPR